MLPLKINTPEVLFWRILSQNSPLFLSGSIDRNPIFSVLLSVAVDSDSILTAGVQLSPSGSLGARSRYNASGDSYLRRQRGERNVESLLHVSACCGNLWTPYCNRSAASGKECPPVSDSC